MEIKSQFFPDHYYFIYDLDEHQIGEYLNTWFRGEPFFVKKDPINYNDSLWTVKAVDEETQSHLYNRLYNPISISIVKRYHRNQSKKLVTTLESNQIYSMKATIRSIDDSSYGIWFNDFKYEELEALRVKIMDWLQWFDVVNGNYFIEFCESLGGTDVDYN